MRITAEAKEEPKRTSLPVMIISEAANQPVDRYADALDRSVEPDATSAVDVTMYLGSILFAGQTDGNAGGNPTGGSILGVELVQKPIGYENILADLLGGEESPAVTRDERSVPTLTKAQIHQSVTVIPASYRGLRCCTCHEDGNSTFTFPYLNADQHFLFPYRYYLQKVTEDPQMKGYFEKKLQNRVSIDRQKKGITQTFVADKGRFERSESARGHGRGVHFAPRGRTPYPGRVQPSGTRGVFNVLIEAMGPIGDEWGTTEKPPHDEADQPHPDSGKD